MADRQGARLGLADGRAAALEEAGLGLDVPAPVADLDPAVVTVVALLVGLALGDDGWIDDNLAFVKPWGFELSEIARPVLVVQGGDDLMVPRQHGEWLAAHVPDCDSRIDDTHGHFTLAEHLVPEVHTWLQSHS